MTVIVGRARTDPVLVVGMHRSGTELVARLLSAAGLFLGARVDQHLESTFFQHQNVRLLDEGGARWDDPSPFDDVSSSPGRVTELADATRKRLEGVGAIEYLGAANAWSGWQGLSAWGFKDPRSTLTLPIWLALMPRARVVHVVRHGVDVARSLVVRDARERERLAGRRRPFLRSRIVRGFGPSAQTLDLARAFALWGEYLTRAERYTRDSPVEVLDVRYEALLTDPAKTTPSVLDFCGLSAIDDAELRGAIDAIDGSRAFAFRRDAGLVELARSVSDELARWGYEP